MYSNENKNTEEISKAEKEDRFVRPIGFEPELKVCFYRKDVLIFYYEHMFFHANDIFMHEKIYKVTIKGFKQLLLMGPKYWQNVRW